MGGDTLMTDQLELFNSNKSIRPDAVTKPCVKCNNVKPLTSFGSNWRRTDGSKSYMNVCSECTYASQRIVLKLKETTPPPPDNYCCPICNSSSEDLKNKIDTAYQAYNRGSWVLDHDHSSGKFRGWLCNKCNSALGWLQDDINYVRRALNYLENFENNS